MAYGITDIHPEKNFPVEVINYSRNSILFTKGQVVGQALREQPDTIAVIEFVDKEAEPEQVIPTTNEDMPPLDHLPNDLRQKVVGMLTKHQDMWSGNLGEIKVTSHRIELIPGAKPVFQPPYRAGQKSRGIEKEEVERMLEAGVIEPALSEWASPVVLITKKDGSTRFCVDYRKLNALTTKDTYPLPRMDDYLDSLGEAMIFSTLDCNSGYWQVPIPEEDRDKTAFVTHCGLHRFTRMPFGLFNAPATFQRALDLILAGVKWKYALVYLDDVIVYSRNAEEHLGQLDHVLSLLAQAGATLKLKKCEFFKSSVNYLGHVVLPGKLAVAPRNVDTIRQAKYPTTRTELRSFLGMCNVYRRFVPGFAKIAGPLTNMLKKRRSRSI
jgi:Reverse transcriptase (RNA-dependent DNA polymerase)